MVANCNLATLRVIWIFNVVAETFIKSRINITSWRAGDRPICRAETLYFTVHVESFVHLKNSAMMFTASRPKKRRTVVVKRIVMKVVFGLVMRKGT